MTAHMNLARSTPPPTQGERIWQKPQKTQPHSLVYAKTRQTEFSSCCPYLCLDFWAPQELDTWLLFLDLPLLWSLSQVQRFFPLLLSSLIERRKPTKRGMSEKRNNQNLGRFAILNLKILCLSVPERRSNHKLNKQDMRTTAAKNLSFPKCSLPEFYLSSMKVFARQDLPHGNLRKVVKGISPNVLRHGYKSLDLHKSSTITRIGFLVYLGD